MSLTYETVLDPHVRGRTFGYGFVLADPWVGATFTGGVKFTLRRVIPESGVGDDRDAVAQASVAGGSIVFTDDAGDVEIPARLTRSWPTGVLYWDLVGIINGAEAEVYTIDSGTIEIVGNVTRST